MSFGRSNRPKQADSCLIRLCAASPTHLGKHTDLYSHRVVAPILRHTEAIASSHSCVCGVTNRTHQMAENAASVVLVL